MNNLNQKSQWRTWGWLSLLPILSLAIGLQANVDPVASEFIASCLRAGTLPTWHPGIDHGTPLAALTTTSPWYPPHWIWMAIKPTRAAPVLFALHVALAGFGALKLVGRRRGAIALALLFQALLIGCVFTVALAVIQPLAWLPWITVGLLGAQQGKPSFELRAAFSCTLALMAGSALAGILVLSCAFALTLLHRRTAVRKVLFTLALGLMLAGVRLLPSVEIVSLELADLVNPKGVQQRAQGEALAWVDAEVPGKLTVSRNAPHRIDVQVEGSSGGWIVFRENWAPDWKCNVNGRDFDVLRATNSLRKVQLPAGDSLVRTWYEPWSLRFGTALSLATLALLYRRKRRESRDPD